MCEDPGRKTANATIVAGDCSSHLEFLGRIAQQFVQRPSHDVLTGILDLLRKQFHSPLGILGFIDEQGRLVCPTLTREAWDRCAMPDKKVVFEIGELGGVLGRVLSERQPVIHNAARPVPPGHLPIHRFLGAPIVLGRDLVGCIFLANSPQDYTEDEARSLGQIGAYLGPTVEAWRKRLDEEQRREQAEQELQRSVQRLQRSMKHLQVLAAISEMADSRLAQDAFANNVVQILSTATRDLRNAKLRLILHGRIYQASDFEETENKLSAAIFSGGEFVGSIELNFLPAAWTDEDTKQEQIFLTEVAERIGALLTRRRAEEEIADTRHQLEALLETTKTRLCVIDETGAVRHVDPWQKRLYGEFRGKSIEEYFLATEGLGQDWVRFVRDSVKQRKTDVFEHPLAGNRDAIGRTTAIPYQDQSSGMWCVATITIDLTEQKRLEATLAQAQRMEAVGHLAAGVAHEINTPIQYIGDNLSYLKEAFQQTSDLIQTLLSELKARDPGSAQKHAQLLSEFEWDYHRAEIPSALEQSLNGVSQVAHIVRAMKVFSHPGTREKTQADLHALLQAAIDVTRNEWKHVAQVHTEFDPAIGSVPLYTADFNMAVVNLIVNAAQAIGEQSGSRERPGNIILRTKALEHGREEIQIVDDGPGIPLEIQDRVFDAFFTTKDVGKGTGQGLTTAYHAIVKKHGGTLEFRSRPGGGTTFFIRIPRDSGPRPPDGTPPVTAPLADVGNDLSLPTLG